MRNDLHIRPVTPHLGAEVTGINLKDAPAAMLGEVQSAFARMACCSSPTSI